MACEVLLPSEGLAQSRGQRARLRSLVMEGARARPPPLASTHPLQAVAALVYTLRDCDAVAGAPSSTVRRLRFQGRVVGGRPEPPVETPADGPALLPDWVHFASDTKPQLGLVSGQGNIRRPFPKITEFLGGTGRAALGVYPPLKSLSLRFRGMGLAQNTAAHSPGPAPCGAVSYTHLRAHETS